MTANSCFVAEREVKWHSIKDCGTVDYTGSDCFIETWSSWASYVEWEICAALAEREESDD